MKQISYILLALLLTTTVCAQNSTITYLATDKLLESSSPDKPGLHTAAFNLPIQEHTFSNGTGTITFGGTLTMIDQNAFKGCNMLIGITLPSTVTTIADGAFQDCEHLETFHLPASVEQVGTTLFAGCDLLQTITVDANNPTYESPKGSNVLIQKSTGTLVVGCKNSTIPDNITKIGEQAFAGCMMQRIIIPESITNIASQAFAGCTALNAIDCYLKAPITISKDVFQDVPSTCELIINPCTITSWWGNVVWNRFSVVQRTFNDRIVYAASAKLPENTGAYTIGLHPDAFDQPVKSHTFADGVGTIIFDGPITQVGNYAFYGCKDLKSVQLPKEIRSIGWHVFDECTNLFSINIPEDVNSIGTGTFRWCRALQYIDCYLNEPITIESSVINDVPKTCKLIVNPNTGSNYEWIIVHGWNLTIVNRANTLTHIVYKANQKLQETTNTSDNGFCADGINQTILCHTFSEGAGVITFNGAITNIGGCTFYNCSDLLSITIPEGVKSLGWAAFKGCSKLVDIYFPQSLTDVESECFTDCNALPIIDGYRFADTYLVEAIDSTQNTYTISPGTRWVGSHAFKNCKPHTIIFPASIYEIQIWAFDNCQNLRTIHSYATTPPKCDDYSFRYLNEYKSLITVYVPRSSVESYRNADGWKLFPDIRAESMKLALSDQEPQLKQGTSDAGDITYTRTDIVPGSWGSYCLPFATTWNSSQFSKICVPLGVALYDKDEQVHILFNNYKDSYIPAGMPFIAKHATSSVVLTNSELTSLTGQEVNPEEDGIKVYNYISGTPVFQNTDFTLGWGGTVVTKPAADNTVIFTPDGSLRYYSDDLQPFRAYLSVYLFSDIIVSDQCLGAYLDSDDDEDATSIFELKAESRKQKEDGKFIENGRLVIMKHGVKYNASGQIIP